jgi:hypothetical protein
MIEALQVCAEGTQAETEECHEAVSQKGITVHPPIRAAIDFVAMVSSQYIFDNVLGYMILRSDMMESSGIVEARGI